MEANARSMSVIGRRKKEFNTEDAEEAQRAQRRESKDFFLVPEVSEGTYVGDDEGDAELVVGADLAELDAAVFEGEAAAFTVVADLHELILQGAIGDVVADPGNDVETATRFAAVAGKHANLIGKRLQDGIRLQAKMGNGGKKFAIGLDLQQCADDGDLAELRVVFEQLLGIKEAAGSDLEVAYDGRRVARSESESEWGDGIERLENVALAVENGAAEGGIKIMLLDQLPGKELLRLVIAGFHPEALCDAIFDFIGIGAGGVGVKADESRKIVDAGDVAIRNVGLDGMFVAPSRVRFVG